MRRNKRSSRRLGRVVWALVPAWTLSLPATTSALTDDERQAGFVPLFNGKDLSDWVATGATQTTFEVRDGLLYVSGRANHPAWLRSEREYENFVLRFDFKLPHYAEGGLFLHAPLHGDNTNVGIEIEICDDVARGAKTMPCGSVFPFIHPELRATKKYGEWNSTEVVCDWPNLRVSFNGKVVQDVDLAEHPELRYRLRRGFLGLQDAGSRNWFRDIRIKELPDREAWTTLFNGRDFDGWDIIGEAKWDVVEGVMRASDGNGYAVTRGKYRDFELFTYVRTSRYANGGIFFRWNSTKDRGYEIQIYNMPVGHNPTGSIYALHRADRLDARDNEWFPMHLIVQGEHCLVRVNGHNVARGDDLGVVREGNVSLQMHRRRSSVEFKGIRIKPSGESILTR